MNNNGQTLSEEEALQFMQTSTSFDEVLPEPVTVTWLEYVEYEEQMPDGRTIKKRKPEQRVSVLSTFVPVKILYKMMASQERIKKIQAIKAKNSDQIDGSMQQEMVDWMSQQVLNVWTLTEPDMTLDKITEGVDFRKIFGLFNLFFGSLLTGLNKQ